MSDKLNLSADFNIKYVYHIIPLHYLVFIARSRKIKSKETLRKEGYNCNHFRLTSKDDDNKRGFGDYAHLTFEYVPPILKAKLNAGFPHIRISIPSETFNSVDYDLCRYNIAKTRTLRKGGKLGYKPSAKNGQYYDDEKLQIPIAREEEDKRKMIAENIKDNNIEIELLVRGSVELPHNTQISCFSAEDMKIANEIFDKLNVKWKVQHCETFNYEPTETYVGKVNEFIKQALEYPEWKGDGLEYDEF